VGRAEVGPICVDEAHSGKGVGSKLLEDAVSFLKEKNVHRVVARVKSGNEKARDFFTRNGFTQEATLKKFTRNGDEAAQYVRLM